MNTPVLFLIFNRPDNTEMVFEEIRKIKPKYLFVAADGPRQDIAGEVELCDKTRKIISNIDWDCQLKTLFRIENLGCGIAVSSALEWFFNHVEMGIILEDDCLPNQSFFNFCEVLLEKYKDDERISTIGGSNYQLLNENKYSYYYSVYSHIWGWATWRRTWKLYNYTISNYSKDILKKIFYTNKEIKYWDAIYCKMHGNYIPNTWDYQLQFINFQYNMLSIIPNINLVKNIGFYNGTHLVENIPDYHYKIKFGNIEKILSPETVKRDYKADLYFYENMLSLEVPSIALKIKRTLYNLYQRYLHE